MIMEAYQKYGIEVGQVYVLASGANGSLVVVDVESEATRDEVLVRDTETGEHWFIDAFKLARVRYSLVA
jgi:hypothetical protein